MCLFISEELEKIFGLVRGQRSEVRSQKSDVALSRLMLGCVSDFRADTLLTSQLRLREIPPTAVGGSFRCGLQTKTGRCFPRIPPTAVGGLFRLNLHEDAGRLKT